MKIHHVRLEGFGPYRGVEEVDFDAFADDGIFLITGRTGAGKTSVLDAITYGIFGRIPRYDGTAGEKVRSDHLGPTDLCEVRVDFSVAAGRFRVTRSPAYQRPKLRGGGLTPEKARFELAQWRDGEWDVIEAKSGNADRHVSDVVPLTAEQFQQVILLAQGQFQEFLVASSADRQTLLSRLFDTSRFTAYSDDLAGRARELRSRVAKGTTQIETKVAALADTAGTSLPEGVDPTTGDGVPQWLATLVAAVSADREAAVADERAAVARADAARAAHDAARTTLERQQRRATAAAQHTELLTRHESVEGSRAEVEAAQRAAVARQAWSAWRTAADAYGRAEETHQKALAQHHAALGRAPGDDLAAAEVELAEVHGQLAAAAGTEIRLPAFDRAARAAGEAVRLHEEKVVQARSDRDAVRERTALLDEESARVRTALEQYVGADLQLSRAQDGLRAARRAAEAEQSLGPLQQAVLAAADAHEAATAGRHDLLRRRYAEYAGVLAADLVAGDPCLVCGGTEHPAPAELAEDHVEDTDLDDADVAVAAAAGALSAARESLTRAETTLTGLREAAGDEPLAAWEATLTAAQTVVGERDGLQQQLTDVTRQGADLAEQEKALSRAVEDAAEHRSRLAATAAAAEADLEGARALVEAHRADHETVAARLDAVKVELEAVRDVLAAARDSAARRQAEVEARAAHDAALDAQNFHDETEVEAALLDPQVLAATLASIREHDRAWAVVTGVLAEPELADLPEEAVDLGPLAEALRGATSEASAATQRSGAAQLRADRVTREAEAIAAALRGTAEVRAEYSVVNALAEVLRGQGQNERKIAIEAFALAAELEEIVAMANGRLLAMTGGRYEFQHDDSRAERGNQSGLSLAVLDAHTGEARSPKSLSGGEKFQASLALALGLAEVVTARAGGIRLDTLFIDEGFGTLDPETLESTMVTLDSLREGGRTVGLISHVGALKETIAAQLRIEVTAGGWSTIHQS